MTPPPLLDAPRLPLCPIATRHAHSHPLVPVCCLEKDPCCLTIRAGGHPDERSLFQLFRIPLKLHVNSVCYRPAGYLTLSRNKRTVCVLCAKNVLSFVVLRGIYLSGEVQKMINVTLTVQFIIRADVTLSCHRFHLTSEGETLESFKGWAIILGLTF